MCGLFTREQVREPLLTEKLWHAMSEECLSKDVHRGSFLKKSVGELKKEGLQWVCSIPSTSPHWSTLGYPEIEAEQGYLQVFSPLTEAVGRWSSLCSAAGAGDRERGWKRKKEQQWAGLEVEEEGGWGSLEQRRVFTLSGGKVCDCATGGCIIIQTPQVGMKLCRHFPTL